ncbi:hypothetical protein MKX01_004580 [Papaver californicum]|nr:hypothetical protein MKX01_004580 [Papaver californicum]
MMMLRRNLHFKQLQQHINQKNTFDGYHKIKNSNGGYGAMLQSGDGTPLAAVAGGSKRCISAYYHILEGHQSGLDLAIQFQSIQFISFVCNSQRVCETLRNCFFSNANGVCRQHPSDTFDVVCSPCLQQKLTRDEPIEFVSPIIREILLKGQCYYRIERPVKAHVKEWNKSADYLAKLVCRPGEEKKFGPDEFPKALWALLKEHGGRNPFMIN